MKKMQNSINLSIIIKLEVRGTPRPFFQLLRRAGGPFGPLGPFGPSGALFALWGPFSSLGPCGPSQGPFGPLVALWAHFANSLRRRSSTKHNFCVQIVIFLLGIGCCIFFCGCSRFACRKSNTTRGQEFYREHFYATQRQDNNAAQIIEMRSRQ